MTFEDLHDLPPSIKSCNVVPPFLRNFFVKVHSPEIASQLRVYLPQNVHEDPLIVFVDGLGRNELRDDWVVLVDLVLHLVVEVLLSD